MGRGPHLLSPGDPNQSGTIGIRISGVVEDVVGIDLVVPVDSLTYTITNYPPGNVEKDGNLDLSDAALLGDVNLGLATLP